MEMTFYNKTNPNVILWNSSSNKRLCKFTNGICITDDKKVIDKLITLKEVEYDKKEYEKYIDSLESKKKSDVEELEMPELKKATKEQDKKEKKSTKKAGD